ncbi:hypothetical protein [Urbifossiella limnaea]|nr:hypothetical protein [Urbifossiella limnaea]
MKPLFAAGYALSQSHADQLLNFFQEMKEVVSDHSGRRFNFFDNRPTRPKGRGKEAAPENLGTDQFAVPDEDMTVRIKSFDTLNTLWLVFGHQTNFGLLWWLVDKAAADKPTKVQIKKFSEQFVNAVCDCSPAHAGGGYGQLSSRIGLLHRLCTGADTRLTLEAAVSKLNPVGPFSLTRISEVMRATVPLLHNEGYQDGTNPTGNAQGHFVRLAKGKVDVGDLYWQVMGNAIATRIMDGFVE